MPNAKRIVIPHLPHHICHRGNLRQKIFFLDSDRRLYLDLLGEHARHHGVAVHAYCLMPNHVHVIATPHDINGLHHTFERVEGDYARAIPIRLHRRGHLWQRRFRSSPIDESHFWAGMVYVEQNPVRAHLVESAEQWRWSSARAHLEGRPGTLLDFTVWRRQFTPESWREQLRLGVTDAALVERIRDATRTGRPSAEEAFLRELEGQLNVSLRPRRRGRPRKVAGSATSGRPDVEGIGTAAVG
jgi:putative transposase